ncbi:MAG: hypothetical protein ACYCTE_01860 [Acidimicrobiales bacterium]
MIDMQRRVLASVDGSVPDPTDPDGDLLASWSRALDTLTPFDAAVRVPGGFALKVAPAFDAGPQSLPVRLCGGKD